MREVGLDVILAIGISAAVLLVLVILMIRPCVKRKDFFAPYKDTLIAHRGLFDNDSQAPENSMAAFARAVEAGFGIELDVQRTKDGQLVIFHDMDMKRMTGKDWILTEHTYEEIASCTLGESEERIPLFQDVLQLVSGKVPMVIEIKVGLKFLDTTRAVAAMLRDYKGIYCIECFNPLALIWYRKVEPSVIRGQLSMDFRNEPSEIPRWVKFVLTHLLLNFLTKPDFIAYNFKDQKKSGFRLCRKLFGVTTAVWTIKSEQELRKARNKFDFFIFDSFCPELGKNLGK